MTPARVRTARALRAAALAADALPPTPDPEWIERAPRDSAGVWGALDVLQRAGIVAYSSVPSGPGRRAALESLARALKRGEAVLLSRGPLPANPHRAAPMLAVVGPARVLDVLPCPWAGEWAEESAGAELSEA